MKSFTKLESVKTGLVTPEELKSGKIPPGDISDPALIAECYELYERQPILNRAIDFDDCIFKVVKALEKDEQLCQNSKKNINIFLLMSFKTQIFHNLQF